LIPPILETLTLSNQHGVLEQAYRPTGPDSYNLGRRKMEANGQ
jgi:hypothetical protein